MPRLDAGLVLERDDEGGRVGPTTQWRPWAVHWRVSASRLYNEYRDQVERVRGLRVASRSVVLWPRVSVSKV